MGTKLKTVHVTLTPQISSLLEAEVAAGRFANISEAIRNAAEQEQVSNCHQQVSVLT
jgi:Arc/MetJ-type ribon-helix-helix transcriptional regulator